MTGPHLNDIRGDRCDRSPTGRHKPAYGSAKNLRLATCEHCDRVIERAHTASGHWYTIDRTAPAEPLHVLRPEHYDTSDAGVLAWSASKMKRRRVAGLTEADAMMHGAESPGGLLSAMVMDGAPDPERRGRLMALADDYERDPVRSVIMRVFAGEIDLTSFIQFDEASE